MFEYKVIPAPKRGMKAKGVKTTEARFAHALETVMNEMGQDGWEYVRTDTLPAEEREGLMGRTTVFQNMMVFRRGVVVEATEASIEEDQLDTSEASADLAEPQVDAHSDPNADDAQETTTEERQLTLVEDKPRVD